MTTKLTQAQIEAAAKITDQDREYADDLLDDIDDLGYEDKIEAIAQWFRKVRHEYALTAAAEVAKADLWRGTRDPQVTPKGAWPTDTAVAEVDVPEQEHIPQKPGQKPSLLPSGNKAAEAEKTMVFCSAEYDAAVEARQKAESTYEVTPQFHLATKRLVAATIERCAQVVENFDLSLEYRVRDTIKAIAAAIRALKNEPLSCPPSPRIEG